MGRIASKNSNGSRTRSKQNSEQETEQVRTTTEILLCWNEINESRHSGGNNGF